MRFLAVFAVLMPALAASARQTSIVITGDRLSGFVLPIEPLETDLRLEALRVRTWDVDDTQRLFLDEDVVISIGAQTFHAPSAVVWLNRIPSAEGLINQIAVYFERVGNPKRRAGLGAEGNQLLLTASTIGSVTMVATDVSPGQPRRPNLLRIAEERLADYLQSLGHEIINDEVILEFRPQHEVPTPPHEFVPIPGGTVQPADEVVPTRVDLPAEDQRLPLLAPSGIVRYSAGRVQFRSGEDENVVLAADGFVTEYVSSEVHEDWSQLTLTAERGVIFTKPGRTEQLTRGEVTADHITGIYLEGNVHINAEEGEYLARAPRVYYDFVSGEAIMMDAILRTYARDSNVPIYARAKEMRQVAANQWRAEKVRVSTSEFFTPHISLGAERAVVTRRPTKVDPESRETFIESDGNTLNVGDVAVLGWPHFQGTVHEPPLKNVTLGAETNDGIVILTSWDLYTLLGREAPEGHEALLKVDGFTNRGAGAGVEYTYATSDYAGVVDLYAMYDDGVDLTSAGGEVPQDNKVRGVAILSHNQKLDRDWRFQAQGTYISDATFISARREEDFRNHLEYETSLYLRQIDDNASFTVLGKYSFNDFISNDYLLASRAYSVNKLPELTYRRYADRLFNAISWSSDTRFTVMQMNMQNTTPNEIGVPGAAFGIPGNVNIKNSLEAKGLTDEWIGRFDTRHDFYAPFSVGAVEVTPFGTARFTAYSEDFQSVNGTTDQIRLFGGGGVRLDTQFQHIDNTVSNTLLDLDRMRHIVEPSVMLWGAATDLRLGDVPIYDQDVEGVSEGFALKAGVRNTFQTQRGGPGRLRTVDWLIVDANVVLTENTRTLTPTPQFFDYRPELSQFGNQVNSTQVWLLSDSVSLIGTQIYDLENNLFARASVGAEINHSRAFRTFVEYRYVNAGENELLGIEWDYRLGKKYRIQFRPQWDFQENEIRNLTLQITRTFPDYDVIFSVDRDEIRNLWSVGASLELAEF